MTKGDQAFAAAIEAIQAAGFVPAGETPVEQFRTGSSDSLILGRSGGKIGAAGGRLRFRKPETDICVTVGKVNTCFYRSKDGKTDGFVNIPTKEVQKIAAVANGEDAARHPAPRP